MKVKVKSEKEITGVILAIIMLVMMGCQGRKQSGSGIQSDDDYFITIDVLANYPKKELILQDLLDVEYIPLETNNDFLCQGIVLAVGREIILIGNYENEVSNGNIFIFDRRGKGLRKINRMGNGGEEYKRLTEVILDEDNNEIFVNDLNIRKILIYDFYGNFKRSLTHKENAKYTNMYNYDEDNLICAVYAFGEASTQLFFIISKQDGSVVKEIKIPFKKVKTTSLIYTEKDDTYAINTRYFPIIPHSGDWMLTSPSSDTVFRYLSDYDITPFIVRTPSIQSMDPEVFLFPCIFSDHYYFMESVKKIYDFNTHIGYPKINLVYDIQEKAIYEYVVYNGDYSERIENMSKRPINDEIVFCDKLEAFSLVEDYKKGLLKGKLKEIAAELKEDSNPVIMLGRYKK